MPQFVMYNPNPRGRNVGDCTVRAISKETGQAWEKVYMDLCLEGYTLGDMPSSDAVWGSYLRSKGYRRQLLPDDAPSGCTVADFCRDHPHGSYILALSGHVVAVENGQYFDSWDSGDKIVSYYWEKASD